ncbi:2-oxoglutarate dehydrogenase E1 component [Cohnella sp. CIP 111063]|uniref:2-oxoglutarate dehydrogenase E1 component n=1 Tax=unclassified Cohnella TaxID=2636738 RepID=UPI000B8BCFB1|nr:MULTISPECIES: 2-oxoglutarate dehydrogenase E1 component [unclassified Cohnella]OXS55257.1 2-oxoglutarate dehydrogenase E1 component [Cohnella sp. CIP 111063]PRX65682.1 2-oxoglutarate dehydrogenase E1 component [Cohnella sp. SGD-V74]
MSVDNEKMQELWQQFFGPNLGYVQEQYDIYLQDAEAVSPQYRELFAQYGAPPRVDAASAYPASAPQGSGGSASLDANLLKKAIAAGQLAWNIRSFGHLAADIDPLELSPKANTEMIEPATYGLTEADLRQLPPDCVWEDAPYPLSNAWEAVQKLLQVYTGPIAFEFGHVHVEEERKWLNKQAETVIPSTKLLASEKESLLRKLYEAEQFEDFLQRTFVGQKRFSAEGIEALVPLTDEIVHELTNDGARHIAMGMAHRGRLNVLAHVLGKPYGNVFAEFHHSPNKNLIPSEGSIGINYGWTGDVKYHLGANRSISSGETAETRITLANNPSHLEYVNPVVGGFARAAQEDRSQPGYPVQNLDLAASILIHGDAAFIGEGIVAETLNFNNIKGYTCGGTIHIIANNRIGFTTESHDSRSTHYASDLAKGFEIPIVHVNADDPEAVIAAARMASEYRTLFKKDFVIDLIGYRRYGHNETDDPETTQPLIYKKVKAHPNVARLYADKLVREGALSEEAANQIKRDVQNKLKDAYDEVKGREGNSPVRQSHPPEFSLDAPKPVTAVPLEKLRSINAGLLKFPESFNVYGKLKRILERRADALNDGEKVDWSHAETLAFATILADGTPIRLSGQDAERATFAHRNLVLHDTETGDTFCPLHAIPEAKASFAIHNSPLSEAGVLGLEYGYNVFAPETMVIWEAQFGDFANSAQVLIDQFISAGQSKWSQRSGLTMLLPHGYEGQGPEHSSARLERFLQLSGEENWTVAYLSSAAQYFHLLRRQASVLNTDQARPLVLMAPKSMIRNPYVASSAAELSEGTFQTVLEQPGLGGQPAKVERIVLCTGKVAIDLAEELAKTPDTNRDWLHIVRVEQLYPFPKLELKAILDRFPNLSEVLWVQEEPKNMGAWGYIEPRIRELVDVAKVSVSYNGRPKRSSPASGYQQIHTFEQQFIINQTLVQKKKTKSAVKSGR